MVIITLIQTFPAYNFPQIKEHANIKDDIQHCFSEARWFLKMMWNDVLRSGDTNSYYARNIKTLLDDLQSNQEEFTQLGNIFGEHITYDVTSSTFKAVILKI